MGVDQLRGQTEIKEALPREVSPADATGEQQRPNPEKTRTSDGGSEQTRKRIKQLVSEPIHGPAS